MAQVEMDYFLREQRRAMHLFMQDLARGVFTQTRDVGHFTAVRLRDGRAFELVVRPTDPDRS